MTQAPSTNEAATPGPDNEQLTTSGPASKQETPNPYVGPRPFTRAERDRFFGRDVEASRLIPLVIAERLVLFYAQSGAGKSSLINARLIPGLEERNFTVLSGRVSGQAEEMGKADNIFIYNLLLSLEQSQHRQGTAPTAEQMAHMTLSEYLADLEVAPPEHLNAATDESPSRPRKFLVDAPQTVGGVQPLALIIDQFEEIFTTNQGAWAQREPFFEQLCEAMLNDPYLWVVLAIREDYIAALDPYAGLLPGKLRARFYMQRMSTESAMEAVRRPVERLRPFEAGAAGELVKNLSLIAVGRDYAEQQQLHYEFGQFVEPVQLQVVCYQLWEELKQHPGENITQEDLNSLTRDQSLANFISNALADFYEQALREVLKLYPEVGERKLRGWFTNELVTETETRSAVLRGSEVTGKSPYDLPNKVVRALQDHFIIRGEIRGENTWYELSHDRFVGPILQANRRWAASNPRLFESDARAWDEAGRPPAKLYDGRQLMAAVDYADQNPDELTDVERDFINQSQKSSSRRKTRRQIAIYAIGGLVVLALSILFFYSQLGWNTARERLATVNSAKQEIEAKQSTVVSALDLAQTASANESLQKSTALAALGAAQVASTSEAYQRQQADDQKATAQVASTKAVYESTQASEQRATAEAANLASQASRLASLSDYFRLTKLDLSLLLAIQGVNIKDGWETRRALFEGLQRGLQTQLSRDGSPIASDSLARSITFSPNGELIAAGLVTGDVSIWTVNGHGLAKRAPDAFRLNFPVLSLAFDTSGNTLAIAGGDRNVLFWDMSSTDASKSVTSYAPFGSAGEYRTIRAIAFQPSGDLLALAAERDTTFGRVFFYNMKTKKPLGLIEDCGALADCTSLAWSNDGRQLAVGNNFGNIRIFEVKSSTDISIRTQLDRGHGAPVIGLAWYRDNQRLVSGGQENRLIEWNTTTNNQITIANRNDTPVVSSLALSPDGRYLVVGSSDPADPVSVWDAETLERKNFPFLVNAHKRGVLAMAFSPLANRFASSGGDVSISIWNFIPVNPLSQTVWQVSGSGRVDDLGLDASGQLMAIQTAGSQLNIWTQEAKAPQVIPMAHSSAALATYNNAPVALMGSFDGQVLFLDPSTGKAVHDPVKVGVATIRALALSLDGKWLAAGACDAGSCTTLVVADLSVTPAALKRYDLSAYKGSITALAFSPDGQKVAAGTDQGMIFMVSPGKDGVTQLVTEGMSLGTVKLWVTSLAFSPTDLGLLAAGFLDNRVALWELATLGPVGAFDERMSGEVSGLIFRQDPQAGWQLVSSAGAGEVRTWSIDKPSWIKRACIMANRNLRDDEKVKFNIPSNQPDLCPAAK